MSAISDTLKSIQSQLYERVSSPLLGSFIISWLLWNHRVVVVLFSDMNVEAKFHYIDNTYFDDIWYINLFHGVFFPFLIAMFYIYVYPFVSHEVYRYHRKKQKKLNEIKQDIEKEELLTVEQSISLRLELSKLKERFNKEIIEKEEQIETLKARIYELTDKAEEEGLSLTDYERDLLIAAAEGDGVIMLSKHMTGASLGAGKKTLFSGADSREQAKWEAAIESLEMKELIDEKNDGHYALTHEGYKIGDTL